MLFGPAVVFVLVSCTNDTSSYKIRSSMSPRSQISCRNCFSCPTKSSIANAVQQIYTCERLDWKTDWLIQKKMPINVLSFIHRLLVVAPKADVDKKIIPHNHTFFIWLRFDFFFPTQQLSISILYFKDLPEFVSSYWLFEVDVSPFSSRCCRLSVGVTAANERKKKDKLLGMSRPTHWPSRTRLNIWQANASQ